MKRGFNVGRGRGRPRYSRPGGRRRSFMPHGPASSIPALKRWANDHCAYGAGRLVATRGTAEEISTENEFTKTTKLCIL